jgi:hypothetical protein
MGIDCCLVDATAGAAAAEAGASAAADLELSDLQPAAVPQGMGIDCGLVDLPLEPPPPRALILSYLICSPQRVRPLL